MKLFLSAEAVLNRKETDPHRKRTLRGFIGARKPIGPRNRPWSRNP